MSLSVSLHDLPEFQRACSNRCLSRKEGDAETREKSRNNSAALAQDPASASRDTHNSIFWVLYATKVLAAQLSPALCDPMAWSSPGSYVHGILQTKNTGMNSHSLLQGIFPTQGLNPYLLCLLHWQVNSLPSEPAGKPPPPINRRWGNSHSREVAMVFHPWEPKRLYLENTCGQIIGVQALHTF